MTCRRGPCRHLALHGAYGAAIGTQLTAESLPGASSPFPRNCPTAPLDNVSRSCRVYVLRHRGPRKRGGNRSNPEASQKSNTLETAV